MKATNKSDGPASAERKSLFQASSDDSCTLTDQPVDRCLL